jgi:two-component system chemotaxis response regulator CheY
MAKILIVDDSALARRGTRKILEGAGYEVVEADEGFSALERFFVEKPSVVLLDVTMKDMDGIEVLKRLREVDGNAKVVIVTADVQSSTRGLAHEGGASGFVIKPVRAESLLEAVQKALQGGDLCN